MKVAYVDTSCVVAIACDEPGAGAVVDRLESYDVLASSTLFEAELISALKREGVADLLGASDLSARISWILPDRPLTAEIQRATRVGAPRGTDVWHLASALYLAEDAASIDFLTLDLPQRRAARALGFEVPV